jgi:polysaccharide deacetylase 2 family uncharacterized protein YibQ
MALHFTQKKRYFPSLKKHGFSAIMLLMIIGLGTYTWLTLMARDQEPAVAPSVDIPLPAKAPQQDTTPPPLPDLLAPDNIPLDANPTEELTLKGSGQTQGPNNTQETQKPSVEVKRPILINGKPVSPLGNAGPTTPVIPLKIAPIAGLTTPSPRGKIPHRSADGRTVLNEYARPFIPKVNQQYISIVIGGLGINPALTRKAIRELPGNVTLSFAAQAPGLQSWINQARAKGHEVLLEIPMENSTTPNANAQIVYTLSSAKSDADNISNLNFLMSRAEGYFALTNYGGDKLIKNEQKLKPILEHMNKAGLGFIYDGSTSGARIRQVAVKVELPSVIANQFIDGVSEARTDVKQSLLDLPSAHDRPVPIGMGFSFEGTINGVKDWLAEKPTSIELAPVSYALKRN